MNRLLQHMGILIVIIYCSYVYLYLFDKGFTGFKPLYWYFLTLGLAIAIVSVNYEPVKFPRYFIIWLWLFLIYNIFNFLNSTQSAEAKQILIINIQTTALLLAFLIIFIHGGIHRVRLALLIIVLLSVPINIIDFIVPMWSKFPGRAAGFYVNPNTSGKVILFSMVACIPLVPQRYRISFCLFAGLGILVTFSRSTWLLWGIALIGLAATDYIAFRNKTISVVVVGILSGIVVFSLLTGGLYSLLAESNISQFLKPQTIARLGGDGSTLAGDSSVDSRAFVAEKSWSVFQAYPWLGAGAGYTREWSYIPPHNMFLMMAAEGGILGVCVFIGLIIVLWRNTDSIGKILIVLFALKSMSSHNMLEQPAMLVFLVLISLSYEHKQSQRLRLAHE